MQKINSQYLNVLLLVAIVTAIFLYHLKQFTLWYESEQSIFEDMKNATSDVVDYDVIEDYGNYTDIIVHPKKAGVKERTQICIHKTTCPDPRWPGYRPSCKHQIRNATPSIHKIIDERQYMHKLLNFFHNRRIAIVGDSLSRQWFETLSCRLGLHPQWYETKKPLPKRLEQAKMAGVQIDPLIHTPVGMKEAHGYGRAYTKIIDPTQSQKKQRENLNKLHQKWKQNGVRFAGCERFSTSIEYMNQKRRPPGNHNAVGFAASFSDIVIVNLGLNNPIRDVMIKELKQVMEDCGNINIQNNNKRCFFRETLPQHFVPKNNNYIEGGLNTGQYVKDGFQRDRCGPINGHRWQNQNVTQFANEFYNVPIIQAEGALQNAWEWHNYLDKLHHYDCTHYCQDNEVWDLINIELIKTAEQHHAAWEDQ